MLRISVFAAVCSLGSAAHAEKLTLDTALDLAIRNSPDLRAAEVTASAASSRAKSVGAHMLPVIALSEELQNYKDPFRLDFPLPPSLPFQFPPFIARNQKINTFSAVAVQPLTGLLHIIPDYAAASSTASAADADAHTARAGLREGVQVGFLRYFEAKSSEAIAKASEDQLAEQIAVSEAKFKAGTVTTADVLRIKVAAANARQQEIAAQAQAQIVRAQLLTTIGLHADDPTMELVEPTDLEAQAAQSTPPPFAEARAHAFQLRPELASANATQRAAARTRIARYLDMVPEVDGEGGYVRLDGQLFAPTESWFIGLKATWTWEWGATFFAGRAASAQADAAAALAQSRAEQIEVDVSTKLSNLTAVQASLDAAKAAIASAEEAYRVTQALVKAGTATTTDLLDAQSALTTARQNLNRATYERAIAQVQLTRTVGKE
jgi:outer membrane protein TolC